MRIGAQFYTLREFCKDLPSFAESLKKIADIGYEFVQISGVCGYEPAWLKEELEKNGLKCVLTHTNPDLLTQNAAQVAADHDVFGCRYVGLGNYLFHKGEPAEMLTTYVETYKPVAQTLREHGKYFMHHNHNHEMLKLGGRTILQHLAEIFAPEELGFTLDTYWVQHGGGDPAYWLEQLKGRIPCIHLKDHTYDGKFASIGEGNINFDRVFEKAEAGGTEYMLVELDDCYGEDPFACLKRSYDYLKACGLH